MEILAPSFGLTAWSLLALFSVLFTIAAIYHLSRSKSEDTNMKLFWLLVILFVPLVGSLAYFTRARKKRMVSR